MVAVEEVGVPAEAVRLRRNYGQGALGWALEKPLHCGIAHLALAVEGRRGSGFESAVREFVVAALVPR